MQNNVKYVFTHFVKYVTLDRKPDPTIARFKYTSNPVASGKAPDIFFCLIFFGRVWKPDPTAA